LSQRWTVGSDTEKLSTTGAQGVPRAIAAKILSLRSFECAFMP
jgi:hypothetical protein